MGEGEYGLWECKRIQGEIFEMKCGISLAAELEDVRKLGTLLLLWMALCCEMCWWLSREIETFLVSSSVSLESSSKCALMSMFNHILLFFTNTFRSLLWPSSVSYNKNTIRIPIIVLKCMIKPLGVAIYFCGHKILCNVVTQLQLCSRVWISTIHVYWTTQTRPILQYLNDNIIWAL